MTQEERSSYNKAHYLANKEKKLAHAKQYYKDNQAERDAHDKEYKTRYSAVRTSYRKARRHTPEGLLSILKQRCKKAGTTIEHYNSLSKKCSFTHCEAIEPGGNGDWHLDHDHATGKFRGLLCARHNRLLGDARDSKIDLQDAVDYLGRI